MYEYMQDFVFGIAVILCVAIIIILMIGDPYAQYRDACVKANASVLISVDRGLIAAPDNFNCTAGVFEYELKTRSKCYDTDKGRVCI